MNPPKNCSIPPPLTAATAVCEQCILFDATLEDGTFHPGQNEGRAGAASMGCSGSSLSFHRKREKSETSWVRELSRRKSGGGRKPYWPMVSACASICKISSQLLPSSVGSIGLVLIEYSTWVALKRARRGGEKKRAKRKVHLPASP